MLFQVLQRMIQRGETEGLRGKMELFHAVGSLTAQEFTDLLEWLH